MERGGIAFSSLVNTSICLTIDHSAYFLLGDCQTSLVRFMGKAVLL
jgi:hypothetical protein